MNIFEFCYHYSLSNAETNHHRDLHLLCLEPLDENLQVVDDLPCAVKEDPVVGLDRPCNGPLLLLDKTAHAAVPWFALNC
jgi:hypothetical protein